MYKTIPTIQGPRFYPKIGYNRLVKSLNGSELAGFIKERQAHQVRGLIQENKLKPKLAIVVCTKNPVIATYVGLKQRYGADIGIDVDVHKIDQSEAIELVTKLNGDPTIYGIIIQLPLTDPSQTDEIVNTVAPEKDVDALGKNAIYDPATPLAILWLLSGYNVDLQHGRQVTLVGCGRLVGAPLKRMLENSDVNCQVIDVDTKNPVEIMLKSDVLISAVGKPGLITSEKLPQNCVVVDAAVASEKGHLVGDLADDVYEREDLTLTPRKGGVGPLTVCALFDNVIRATRAQAKA